MKRTKAAKEHVYFHPGIILAEEFMQPIGLTSNALAMATHVPANRISNIVRGRAGITADTAIRLGRYFGNGEEICMNLQRNYELARRSQSTTIRALRSMERRKFRAASVLADKRVRRQTPRCFVAATMLSAAGVVRRRWSRGTGPGGAIPFSVILPCAISNDDD